MGSFRKKLPWALVTVCCGLLLAVSLVPKARRGQQLRELLGGKDKVLHGLAYGVLPVLSCRAIARQDAVGWWHVLAAGVLFAVGYGALLEAMRAALNDRTSSVVDAGANAIGAGSGGLLWLAAALRSSGSRTDTGLMQERGLAARAACAPQLPWQERWLDKYYRGKPGWVDGTTQFMDMCGDTIRKDARILDLGAEPTNKFTAFLATLGEVTGLDIDHAVLTNQTCSKAVVYDGLAFPLPSEAFDAVVSNYVTEHIEYPSRVAAEVFRVLRPGGVYAFRTPNVWHPVAALSVATPHWVHKWVSAWARRLPRGTDVCPTHYRMNTKRKCRGMLEVAGFQVEKIVTIEKEPSYGMSSRALLFLFLAYERLVNLSDVFGGLRANILCVARKPDG